MSQLEPVHLEDVRCVVESDKALLVEFEGEQHWVPKSQIHEDSEVYKFGTEGTLVVSGWFAKQRGWD